MDAMNTLQLPRYALVLATAPLVAAWQSLLRMSPRREAGLQRGTRTRWHEAEQVRALAQSVSASDPGFAADLYAAAARHESAAD
jgi:hypothetical protein